MGTRAVLLAAAVATGCLDAPPASTAGACSSFSEWGDPVAVPGLSSILGTSPTVDAAASIIVWETGAPDNQLADGVRDGDGFAVSTSSMVAELNTIDPDRNPTLSDDGLTIWFTRDTQDQTLLFASHRDAVTEPFPPADQVQGLEMGIEGPDVWDEAKQMVFSVQVDDLDLAHARCEDVRTCTYEGLLPGLQQELDDVYPTIRSDGLEIIYFSRATDGMVSATRPGTSADFEPGGQLPFGGNDPELTADGTTLYFASDAVLYRSTRECIE